MTDEQQHRVSGLIQVDDPLETKEPVAKPIGIDLGTTFSLVAHVSCGRPAVIADGARRALLPSVVHYRRDGGVDVGDDAVARAIDFPEDTIASAKRFMGKGADDAETRRLGSYRFAAGAGPVVRFAVAGEGGAAARSVSPVEVSAEILLALRARAEKAFGAAVGGAVITVPAYFDEAQRQATKDAGRLAGLTVLRLLNEPTAAALAYGLDKKQNGLFAIYDLGGGTFDISILKLVDGVFQVQATGGDTALGGDDFDRAVAARLLEAVDSRPAGLIRAALAAAREAKHRLTEATETVIEFEYNGQRFKTRLVRDEFDTLIRPWVERTAATCRRAMKDAGCAPGDLDGVILVGGSTRVPLVRRFVRDLFGKDPFADIDPDQVVALGAAVQADLLAGTGPRDEVLLLDVTPLSLGLEMMGGVVEKIVPRNSPIPTSAAQVFTTYADAQTGMEIHVVQGERDLVADCRSLAHFTLRGIPPMPAGIGRVKVTFLVDADGLLQVTAEEETTHTAQTIAVTPTYGLTDEEVLRMLLESYERAEGDVRERALREQRVEAARILAATESAMAADRDLVTAELDAAMGAAMKTLRDAAAGTNADAIRAAIAALDEVAVPFAEARMNRAIGSAVRGKSVDAVLEKDRG
ncbi:MAG: Fe-S protein assembly chaperone HscA [Deltaproteobacteria bacterium]|nr:Fe-S protein assembly chaperone HscA [Deltaproteobacteria bacterium]